MNPPPNERDKETDKAIQEFLDKGGKITYCDPLARSENVTYNAGFYGRKKKPQAKKEDTE